MDQGQEVHSRVLEFLQRVRTTLREGDAEAKQLPTDDPKAFQQAATQIGTSIESDLSSVGDPLKGLNNAALEQAAHADPSCQKLESQ